MCRNIKRLRQPGRQPTEGELNDASLQFVRKISGFHTPSHVNQRTFDRAVREVARAGRKLFDSLEVRQSGQLRKTGEHINHPSRNARVQPS